VQVGDIKVPSAGPEVLFEEDVVLRNESDPGFLLFGQGH